MAALAGVHSGAHVVCMSGYACDAACAVYRAESVSRNDVVIIMYALGDCSPQNRLDFAQVVRKSVNSRFTSEVSFSHIYYICSTLVQVSKGLTYKRTAWQTRRLGGLASPPS